MESSNKKLRGRWTTEFDENGKTVKVVYEASFRRLLGYEEAVELDISDDSWFESIHPDDRPAVEEAYVEALQKHTEEFDYDVEYRMKTASGDYRWFHDYAHCIRRADGSLQRFDGVIFDIQDAMDRQEKLIVEQQNALKDALVFANYFVDTFVSTYLVNLKTHTYKVYSRTDELNRDYPVSTVDYWDSLQEYAAKGVHPDDRGPFLDFLAPANLLYALQDQNSVMFPYRDISDDVEKNYVVHVVRGSDENTVAFAFSDITGQVKNRTVANRSELNAMLSLLEDLDSVFIIDPASGDYSIFLPGADSIEHYTTMRKEGQNFYDDIPVQARTVIHEEDRGKFLAFYSRENLLKIVETGEPQEIENRWFVKEGLRIIRNKAVPRVDAEGKKTIILGVWDLTDEREKLKAEQEGHMLQAFGDMMNAATWRMELGENGEVTAVHWSNELCHMFGFESEKDFPNELSVWTERLHPDDRERVNENFSQGVQEMDSGVIYDVEYRFMRKDGEYRWYHAYGRIEKNNEGGRIYYGIVVDISAEKALEESHRKLEEQQKKIEEALAMAQSANRAKTTFLFNMSHDIRTPMNAIMGFSDIALKNPEDTSLVKSCIEKSRNAGALLLSIINSILDMSRIEAGEAKVEETAGDVLRSFESIETTMHSLAVAKSINLTFSYGDIADRYVYFDHERCTRVFVNLISNAIKYTKTGGWVHVSCEQVASGRYRYTFADNGIGMSEEFQKHLFEEFARERNSTTSGIQGTGLGLALCKSFVELMGGSIECKSKQGEGTTFTVELPFRIRLGETDNAADVALVATNDEMPALPTFKGKRILLVEDNELNLEVATFMLEEQGFNVETANDGSLAVKLVKANGVEYYDFILMDIQMPIMGGYDATKAIRNYGFKRPIIALSANAFAEDRAASIAAGMDGHVAKPIKINELFEVLAKFLQ